MTRALRISRAPADLLSVWAGMTLAALSLVFVPSAIRADVDDDAAVVLLREDCTGLENCFDSMKELSEFGVGWIWAVREPSAASPLIVDIGPGEFDEPFECYGGGWVTLRGAGREATIIGGFTSITPNPRHAGASVVGCQHLEFRDMTLRGVDWGVRWAPPGSSTWINTDVIGLTLDTETSLDNNGIAWADDECPTNHERAVHYFFDSRVIQRGTHGALAYGEAAFWANCSETWFFGGEVAIDLTEKQGGNQLPKVVELVEKSDFRAFGTAIRVIGGTKIVAGVSIADAGSQLHLHGGSIEFDQPDATTASAFGIQALAGLAHTPGSTFRFDVGSASVTRLQDLTGNADILSPFEWPAGVAPPDVTSLDGQDLFVETDCDSSGDCDGAGDETHLMVYNATECGSSNPWFDLVTGACRQ